MSKTSLPGHGSDTAERLRSQRRSSDQTRNIVHALLSTTQSSNVIEKARILLKEAYPRVTTRELLFTSRALDTLNRASVLFTEAYRGETVHTLMITSRTLDILERIRILLAEAYQRETGTQTLPMPPGQTAQQDRVREEHIGEIRCTFVNQPEADSRFAADFRSGSEQMLLPQVAGLLPSAIDKLVDSLNNAEYGHSYNARLALIVGGALVNHEPVRLILYSAGFCDAVVTMAEDYRGGCGHCRSIINAVNSMARYRGIDEVNLARLRQYLSGIQTWTETDLEDLVPDVITRLTHGPAIDDLDHWDHVMERLEEMREMTRIKWRTPEIGSEILASSFNQAEQLTPSPEQYVL